MQGPQDDPGQGQGKQRRPDEADTDGRAHGGGYPDARGSGQALDFVLFGELEDASRAQETDAGGDSLDDATRVGLEFGRDESEQGRTQGHQHVGSQAGSLMLRLALEPNQAAENARDTKPQDDAPDMRRILHAEEHLVHEIALPLPLYLLSIMWIGRRSRIEELRRFADKGTGRFAFCDSGSPVPLSESSP